MTLCDRHHSSPFHHYGPGGGWQVHSRLARTLGFGDDARMDDVAQIAGELNAAVVAQLRDPASRAALLEYAINLFHNDPAASVGDMWNLAEL